MKRRNRPYYYYLCFSIAYLAITFLLPPNHTTLITYHLTPLALRLLSLTVVLPSLGIWFAAFYGYVRLNEYASFIKHNKDGIQINKLAQGLTVLAFSLPLTSITSSILNYLAQLHPHLLPTVTIINHYISLALPLIAFLIISRGTRGLMDLVRQRPPLSIVQLLGLVFAIVSAGYCYFVFKYTSIPGLSTSKSVYYLPNWLVLFTIVVPYVFMWFIAGLSAIELYSYNNKTTGIIYRQGWDFISSGIAVIILTFIILQYFTSLSGHLNHLDISGLLLIVYAFLAILAVGFILVAWGAKKLQKIEEV